MMRERRIVVIDNHIIAEFRLGDTGWWTCSKAFNGNEDDHAVWPYSEKNMEKALNLIKGDITTPVVHSHRKPVERNGRWYTDDDDMTPKSHRIALCKLARSL